MNPIVVAAELFVLAVVGTILFVCWPLIMVLCFVAILWFSVYFLFGLPLDILRPLLGNRNDPAPSKAARKARWAYYKERNAAVRNPDKDGYVEVKPMPAIADYWPKDRRVVEASVYYEQGEEPAVLAPLVGWVAMLAFGVWMAMGASGFLS